MRSIVFFVLIAFLLLPAPIQALTLEGNLVQGGMAIGRTAPGTTVKYEGKSIRVSPDGLFVIGFGRDDPADSFIEVHHQNKAVEKHPVTIKKRIYEIQRIDGLPQRKVSPSPEDFERIGKEATLVKAVRKKDLPSTDFSQKFLWPVIGRISGVYGSQRVLNGKPRRPHYGVDIAAPTGTPVRAPTDGVVTLVHEDMFYSGGTLIFDHGHGLSTSYLHLHKILVEEGQRVEQGDTIAQVGATGRVTGAHLHWGMNWFNTRLDPSLPAGPMPKSVSTASDDRPGAK